MDRPCANCAANFVIDSNDTEFYAKISPNFAGELFPIPAPTLCPDCRLQRRAVWRNEFKYYPRVCPQCRHRSISIHSETKPYPVYCNRCWWNDATDLRTAGADLDLSRSFFAQFAELQARCPKPFMANDNHSFSENIEYCQGTAYSKNCYLVSTSWRLQDCLHCSNCGESRDLVDCRFVGDGSELVYESATCQRCYSSAFLYGCSGCSNCRFGIDLRGCTDCIACVGLQNKRHHIFNRAYSPEAYATEAARLDFGSFAKTEALKAQFVEFADAQPQRGVLQVNCERSSGNNLFNCKNFSGFNVWGGEDCRNYVIGTRPKNCQDILVGGEHEWCYEGVNPDHSYQSHFTVWCWSCTNVLYSDNCHSSRDLFGCVGLRRSEYCILNKQYSKAEYEALVPQLVASMQERGEWGEFFPISVSPFAYNETVAQDYAPLTADEAAERGFAWTPENTRDYQRQEYAIADHISGVPDIIIHELLACTACRRNFKIVALELLFYRKLNLPVPRVCPDCRRNERFARTGLFTVWQVPCSTCASQTESATAPDNRSTVLCSGCYEALQNC